MVAGLKDCLLYVSDRKSGRRFLVDTGAEISVIPATGLKTRTSASSQPLLAANGSSIQTYGKHNFNLRLRTGDYCLRTGDYRLRTGDYRLRTGDYRLRTGDYRLRTGDYRLRTGYYRLRTGDYRLRTGDYRLRTGDYRLRTGDYRLRTGDYRLRTGDYCLRTGDYRLRTGDYRLRTGDYRWDFVVAEVTRPLLGADFLRAHSLLVDLNTKQLIDANQFNTFDTYLFVGSSFGFYN